MNEVLKQHIQSIFEANQGYAQTGDLTSRGIHTAHIKKLEEEGQIIKLKRGLYRWNGEVGEAYDEWVDVSKLIPQGVICLLSALSFYELTTYQPWQYDVAIHRNGTRITLPDYPPIRLFYFSDAQYHLGIVNQNMNGHQVPMYDVEKTLCDAARYRNRIGVDIVKESFKRYVQRRDKRIDKLLDYARQTRVTSVVERYLEVLL
jgi:predicted transcriptional regulator of viral defense system